MSRNPDERESWVTPSADDDSLGPTQGEHDEVDSDAKRAAADGVSPSAASDAMETEVQQYRELAQRVQADFENYRKRVLREQTAVVERATEALLEDLLPVLDSFELAVGMLDDAEEKVRKGVELVYAELVGVLEKNGLERIDTDGKPFDPNVHECVMQDDGDGEPVVAETMRTGYRLKGRVLRPAMVKVTR